MSIQSSIGKKFNGTKPSTASLYLGLVAILPAIIAGFILHAQRLPYPYQDDFQAVLGFASQYQHAPGLAAKAKVIAVFPYNGYRLIFEHVVIGADLAWSHRLHFGFFNALGNLFLLGIAALLWCSFERTPLRSKLLYFLPVNLIFFSLVYWETLNWTEATLQNVPVIFFALWSLYLLGPKSTSDHKKWKFLLSCFAALVCCSCSPNGFLLAPAGVLMLASQRRFKQALLWPFSFILPFFAYLYHPAMGPVLHSSALHKIFFFIAFFGGAFAASYALAFLVGVALLLLLIWAARAGFAQQSPVLFFFAIWIVLTDALVELNRASINSRYSIYSVLILVCCYEFLLRRLDREPRSEESSPRSPQAHKRFLRVAIALSACFYVAGSVWAYRHLGARREMVVKGMRFYRANPLLNSPQANAGLDRIDPEEKPFELRMLNQAAQEDLYTVPAAEDLQK